MNNDDWFDPWWKRLLQNKLLQAWVAMTFGWFLHGMIHHCYRFSHWLWWRTW